jgi:hypothetical protein
VFVSSFEQQRRAKPQSLKRLVLEQEAENQKPSRVNTRMARGRYRTWDCNQIRGIALVSATAHTTPAIMCIFFRIGDTADMACPISGIQGHFKNK